MIELRAVSVSLSGKPIVENLSWQLPDPGLYLLVGGNASGKTILSRILGGLLRPGRGGVFIDGESLYQRFGGYGLPVFHAAASEGALDDEPLETYLEVELRNAGASFKDVTRTISELRDDLHIDPARALSRIAHSELLLAQLLLAASVPTRLCVLDGHLTFLDRYHLAAASSILERVHKQQERFVVLTTNRLAGAFPAVREVYLLSGGTPLELYRKPDGAAIDTGLNPVYGAAALRVYTQGLATGMSGVTSAESFLILSMMEDGLRIQLRGTLDDCVQALRRQGLIVNRIEWETLT